MRNDPATYILGLVALIAAGGCGSGSGRPSDTPPAVSPADVPSVLAPDAASTSVPTVIEPSAAPPAPVMEAGEGPRPIPGFRRDFDTPLRAPAVATGDPELDPLVSYLKASFAVEIKNGRRLVIRLSTGAGLLEPKQTYQELVDRLLRGASDQVPAGMIRDFCEKNRGSSAVWPELTRHLPAILMTPEEHKVIFSGFPGEGWKRFYAKYPDAYGIIDVSRVGLNRDKDLAFFYVGVGQGPLLGHGQYHVLKKVGEAWIELPIDIGGAWTA